MLKEDLGGLAILGAILLIIWFSAWGRNMPMRYALQFSTSSDSVAVEGKPKDCDFLSAPLGRKNCSYKKRVRIEQYRADPATGVTQASADRGENWYTVDGPVKDATVFVYWEKIDD